MNCLVCLESLINGEIIHSTSCGHLFHCVCLGKWLRRNTILQKKYVCPQCGTKNISHHRIFLGLEEEEESNQCREIDTVKTDILKCAGELKCLGYEFLAKQRINDEQIRKLEILCFTLRKKFSTIKTQLKWFHARMITKKELFSILASQRSLTSKYRIHIRNLQNEIGKNLIEKSETKDYMAWQLQCAEAKLNTIIKDKDGTIVMQSNCCQKLGGILAKILDIYKSKCSTYTYALLLKLFGYATVTGNDQFIFVQRCTNSPSMQIHHKKQVDLLIMESLQGLLQNGTN